MEEFKVIPNFENYSISNLGNLKNNKKNKILSTYIAGYGYKYCRIINKETMIKTTIHNLVAKLFIGERPKDYDIDHIDKNKLNNNVDNLRYCTKSENLLNRNIELKPRKNSKTEFHHITKTKENKYIIQIKQKYYGIYNEINDAIKTRDDILNKL